MVSVARDDVTKEKMPDWVEFIRAANGFLPGLFGAPDKLSEQGEFYPEVAVLFIDPQRIYFLGQTRRAIDALKATALEFDGAQIHD